MAYKIYNDLDISLNQLLNAVFEQLASDPGTPVEGQFWVNTTSDEVRIHINGSTYRFLLSSERGAANGVASLNGSALVIEDPVNAVTTPTADKIVKANGSGKIDNGWLNTGSGNNLDADKLDNQEGSYYLDRANHTGTQLHTTISDFDAGVQTNRLDQMTTPTANVSMGSQKITNLGIPTSANDAATKDYVDGLATGGISLKTPVVVVEDSNINISSPGGTIDGVSLTNGDRILLVGQTTKYQNGIWLWDSAITPLTRPSDFNGNDDIYDGVAVRVQRGTDYADSKWVQINAISDYTSDDQNWIRDDAASVNAENVVDTVSGATVTPVYYQKVDNLLRFMVPAFDTDHFIVTENAGESWVVDLKRASGTIGDGVNTSFEITHSWNTRAITVSVWNATSGVEVHPQITHNLNSVEFDFGATVPTSNQFGYVIQA